MSELDFADPGLEAWRERLVVAKTEYQDAASRLEEAIAAAGEIPEARARLLAARAEYLRLLRGFSDLILGGRRPADAGQKATPDTRPPANP